MMNGIKIHVEDKKMILPEDGMLRFSVVWKHLSDGWKINHVHNSIPAKVQGEEVYFNYSVAKSQYTRMMEDIQKATKYWISFT